MRTIMAAGLTLLVLTGCGASADERTVRLRPIVELAAQRILLADDVAADKHATGAPVEDLPREAVVLGAAAARARELGLDPEAARAVVGDQIRASKAVQTRLLHQWATGIPARPSRADLGTLRRSLDVLTDDLLIELNRSAGELTGPTCRASIERARRDVELEHGLGALHVDALGVAVGSLCR